MKKTVAPWSDFGALTTAGTVAATIFCCLPFATGVVEAALRVRRADDAATAGVRRTQPGLAGVLVLSSLSTGSDVLGRRLRRPHCLATPPTADLGCGVRGGRDADGELVGELGDLLEPVEKDRLW
jgi:hypothetical protein